MRCLCGRSFNWSEARPVVPCNHLHRDGLSFSVCPGCSPVAKAKLAVAQLGVGAIAATGVTMLTAASIASISTTMALFLPPAVLYEPVRRYRNHQRSKIIWPKKKKLYNVFAFAALSGAVLPMLVLYNDDED